MTRYLLDVNILIALYDGNHVHHNRAHVWFSQTGRHQFATCSMTQNGLLRIVGHPKYPAGPGTPLPILSFLEHMRGFPGFKFWTDENSITDPNLFIQDPFVSAAQLTDVYLLGLAVSHKGTLATFDRRINTKAVIGGPNALCII